MPNQVAIVVKGYPRLSETFIAQEILGLQQLGLGYRIVSLRRPTDPHRHPVHDEIEGPVDYLPEYLYEAPLRVLRAWWRVRGLPGYSATRRCFIKDLKRDFSPNRFRRFGQALVAADELPEGVDWIYAHFLHTPASVARYAALMRGLPWSCSAHAKDIWTTPDWEKKEKLADMDWLVTCTRTNADHLRGLVDGDATKVGLVYHGIDFGRFPDPPEERPERDGGDPDAPVRILSVGRAVEKKGYDVLLEALSRLPESVTWRFTHIGGGALLDDLKARADRIGITDRIEWLGALPQQDVLEHYRRADLFVLASRVAEDGDRDGLPNVLMEAQSQGLACISTRVSAVPELIGDKETGLLVAPDDPDELARAIAYLVSDPDLRRRIGRAGSARVRGRFSHEIGLRHLAVRFGLEKEEGVSP